MLLLLLSGAPTAGGEDPDTLNLEDVVGGIGASPVTGTSGTSAVTAGLGAVPVTGPLGSRVVTGGVESEES